MNTDNGHGQEREVLMVQDAHREDGGELREAILWGQVGGIGGGFYCESHRFSLSVRGDARKDLRFATGGLPDNWMSGSTRRRSPHLLTTGFARRMVVV
jgi:hypothetical protein